MNKTLFLPIIVGLVVGFFLIFLSVLFFKPYIYQGSTIDPASTAPGFTLSNADGSQFRLVDYRGKVVLLYFGYTFCPDVCPTTLYDLTRVKETLGEDGNNIVVAMITVDPERDTREMLFNYVTTFDPAFIGLSDDIENLESVWSAYGVYRKENDVDSSAGYLVDHTARVYVIDRLGNLRMTFPFGMTYQAMADDLEYLLAE
jgi:protein SCO1/2